MDGYVRIDEIECVGWMGDMYASTSRNHSPHSFTPHLSTYLSGKVGRTVYHTIPYRTIP